MPGQSKYFTGGQKNSHAGKASPLKDVIGHRGMGMSSRLYEGCEKLPKKSKDGEIVLPENTLRSFTEAMRQGANGIEFDVKLSRGEPMVIHDDELAMHTKQGKRMGFTPKTQAKAMSLGKVSEKTPKELRVLSHFDLGEGDRIPTLRETLKGISQFNLGLLESQGDNASSERRKAMAKAKGKPQTNVEKAYHAALLSRDENGLARAGIWDESTKKVAVDQELPRLKGKPRKHLVYPNIELKEEDEEGKAVQVAQQIFQVIRDEQEQLIIQGVVFCGFAMSGMAEIRNLVEHAEKSGSPLKNWRGERLVFKYSWGNKSEDLFAQNTVFGPGFVAYESHDDLIQYPFKFASTDPARIHARVDTAKSMKMTSLDITSSDFDANVAKVLAQVGMEVIVTHVANRTSRQCEWRSWGRTPIKRIQQERWEITRVMKLALEYGAHVSYKADFPGTALKMKQNFDPSKECTIDTVRSVTQITKFTAYALIMSLEEDLKFAKPPKSEWPKSFDLALLQKEYLHMLKLWSSISACADWKEREARERAIYAKVDTDGTNPMLRRLKSYLAEIDEESMSSDKCLVVIVTQSPKERRELAAWAKKILGKKVQKIKKLVQPLTSNCAESTRRAVLTNVIKELSSRKELTEGNNSWVSRKGENFFKLAWAVDRYFLKSL